MDLSRFFDHPQQGRPEDGKASGQARENADLLKILTRLDRGDWESVTAFGQAA